MKRVPYRTWDIRSRSGSTNKTLSFMGRIASSSFFLFFLFTNQQQTAAYKLGSNPLSSRILILVVTKHFPNYLIKKWVATSWERPETWAKNSTGPNNWSHVIFIVFFRFWTKSAGGDVIFVVKKKFRAFWCIICLCSWIRSYLPPKNFDRKPWPDCDIICHLSSLFNTLVYHHLADLFLLSAMD